MPVIGDRNLEEFAAALAPLTVDPALEIETLVGLRPYRDQGFVVRAEKHGGKIVVHNYGHGGSGVTLSWGSAELAAQAAAPFACAHAAVIGAGVIGLTTALTLLHAGTSVTIYAECLPPRTTSNVAAALWRPARLFRPERVGAEFVERFRRAARVSYERFCAEAGDPQKGVRWIRMFDLADENPHSAHPEGEDLYPDAELDQGAARRFGVAFAERYRALVVDMSLYMPALLAEIARGGGRIERRRLNSLADVATLTETVVFNCSGFGARALFGDRSLTPVRGQITLIAGQPEIDYGYVYEGSTGLLYMFPRTGAIALGGSMGHGEASLAIDAADRRRMFDGHRAIAARLRAQA